MIGAYKVQSENLPLMLPTVSSVFFVCTYIRANWQNENTPSEWQLLLSPTTLPATGQWEVSTLTGPCIIYPSSRFHISVVSNLLWFPTILQWASLCIHLFPLCLYSLIIQLHKPPSPQAMWFLSELTSGCQRDFCSPMFTAVCAIARGGNPTDERIRRAWCSQTIKKYSALTKRGIPHDTTVWMDLEDTVWGEVSCPRDRDCMIPLKDVSKVHRFIEPKNGMGVPSGWEEGKWDLFITGIKFQSSQVEQLWSFALQPYT